YFVVRTMSPRTRLSAAAMPVMLFLCCGGVRTLLQFSRFSLTLAFAAAVFADSRAVPSGICLGIALAKPHLSGPIRLWLAFTCRARTVAIAAGVVLVGFGSYCVRVGSDPLSVVVGYWTGLTIV